MKVLLNGINITMYVSSLTWSGTAIQASRTLDIELANNPYDKSFKQPEIVNGDIITFKENKETYVGICTGLQKKSAIGTVTYNTKDFLHYLLRGSYSHKFKNKTPEYITKKVCMDVGIKVGTLEQTKVHISKLICDSEPPYNAIVKAYNKATKKTEQGAFMPIMNGTKLCVIPRWLDSNVILNTSITDAEYNENSDEVINQVTIFDDKGKKIGIVKSKNSIAKYGVYQEVYTKEKGVNAKKAAEKMFHGPTKEATVESIGYIEAIAGRVIKIKNKATGIVGAYAIESDSHTISNGIHTMQLTISRKKGYENV